MPVNSSMRLARSPSSALPSRATRSSPIDDAFVFDPVACPANRADVAIVNAVQQRCRRPPHVCRMRSSKAGYLRFLLPSFSLFCSAEYGGFAMTTRIGLAFWRSRGRCSQEGAFDHALIRLCRAGTCPSGRCLRRAGSRPCLCPFGGCGRFPRCDGGDVRQ